MKTTIISVGIVILFLGLAAYPALADSVVSTKATLYYMPWMRNDGTEVNGTLTLNDSSNIIKDTWLPEYQVQGVYYSAMIDQIYGISTNENISVVPYVGTVYYSSATFLGSTNFSNVTYHLWAGKTIPVVTFNWELSPNKVMTGCEEIYYRSPLVWNDPSNIYMSHFLNIYDDSGNLVWANTDITGSGWDTINRTCIDNSAYNGTGGQRIYYKIDANFRANVKYTFREFVGTFLDTPVNTIHLYMAPTQDIGDDGLTDTFCFLGTPNSRKVPFECSWSAIATIGIGVSGTETIVYSNKNFVNLTYANIKAVGNGNQPLIVSQTLHGTMKSVGSIEVIFPLRTTQPLNISIYYWIFSGGSSALHFGVALEHVTGTVHTRFNIVDPSAGAVNNYTLEFRITNFGVDGEAMSYYMYPATSVDHLVWNENAVGASGGGKLNFKHFAMHVEVNEYAAAGPADTSARAPASLWDWISIAIGIFIIVAAVVIEILTGGLGTPAVLAAVGIGAGFITLGATGASTVIMNSIISGTAHILLAIGSGIWAVAGALWRAAVWVVETLVNLGEQILYYGALIGEAIWQIIWLLAFIIVVWIWAKFLDIMKWVTLGKPENALSDMASVENAGNKQVGGRVKRAYGNYKKIKKWYRR